MTEEELYKILNITEDFLKKCQEIADRWVKAWKFSGYYGASGVGIDFKKNVIRFQSWCPDGVSIPFGASPYEVSLNYLIDSSSLEYDSQKWYENDLEKRRKKSEYENQLKNDPKVREYIGLTQPFQTWGTPRVSNYIFHE